MMEKEAKFKLERYFKNASKFLWGLSRKNQKDTYLWLRTKGKKLWGETFDFTDGTYKKVGEQLLENPGIDKVIKDLVFDLVTQKLFTISALNFIRECWFNGTLPNLKDLDRYNIKDPHPFLQVNTQFNYVERWEEFAGLWFEDLEPWLKTEGKSI